MKTDTGRFASNNPNLQNIPVRSWGLVAARPKRHTNKSRYHKYGRKVK